MPPQPIPSRFRPRSHLRRRILPLIATLLAAPITRIALPLPAHAIVGGSTASPGSYPFMVSLRENGFPYCGGTLVAPRWVLTAAHCATGRTTGELTAVVDQVKVAGTGGEARGIDRISVDPSYDPTTEDYDAALLHLAATTIGIAPQPLIRSGDRAVGAPGTVATVIGYGSTSPQAIDGGGPITYPASLQQTQVAIVSNTRCAAVFNGRDEPNVRTDLMMCAGGDGHRDACVGDSGGPLLVPGRVPGTWTDVAITSWGAGCAVAGVPGVYTRLADPQIADFVESTLTGP